MRSPLASACRWTEPSGLLRFWLTQAHILLKKIVLITKPVTITSQRTHCAGRRLAKRAPAHPPAVASPIIHSA